MSTRRILYFPPGQYFIHPINRPTDTMPRRPANADPHQSPYRPSLWIPRDISLLFAEGAALCPRDGAVILIEGNIENELQHIFRIATSGQESQWGQIVFTSRVLRRVYPEWWGASGNGANDDTIPLQSAIDAAVNRRLPWPSNVSVGTKAMPPIPIILTNQYAISRTLQIGFRDSDPLITGGVERKFPLAAGVGGFIIRAGSGLTSASNGRSSIVAQRHTSDKQPAMILMRETIGGLIENVSFNAGGLFERCVALEPQPEQRGVFRSQWGTRFRRCTFTGATKALAQVGFSQGETAVYRKIESGPNGAEISPTAIVIKGMAITDKLVEVEEQDHISSTDFSLTTFEGCLFLPAVAECYGIEMRAGNSFPIIVEGCRFKGPSQAMIYVTDCSFMIKGCHFANTLHFLTGLEKPTQGVRSVVTRGLARGVDIFLGLENYQPPPTSSDAPVIKAFYASEPTSSPAGGTVINCTSTSAQFLATYELIYRSRARRTQFCVTLIGVRHIAPSNQDSTISSIQWGIGGQFFSAGELDPLSKLVLIGCRLSRGVLATQFADPVVDIGTVFDPPSRFANRQGLDVDGVTLFYLPRG